MDGTASVLEAFFARQPIFDDSGNALAYELLYRSSPEAVSAAAVDPEQMSARVTVDAMLGMNLATVTDGMPAFLNATRDMLVSGFLESLDPSRLVIEILETVEPDDAVVSACARLRQLGHTLALDDWFENDPRTPLLPYASIIKVDVLDRSPADAAKLVAPLRDGKRRLLAERVENAEVHQACLAAGFEWFQGYYYRRPEIVRQPDLRPDQLLIVNAMNLVQDDAVSDQRLGGFFKRDPALAYKLVRMANAAPMGVRQIESVEHAVFIVGRASIFRWLGLLLTATVSGQNGIKRELVRETLVRARQCELLAEPARVRPAGHLFLVGLFSRIEALLGVSLATIVDKVVLPGHVTAALTARDGPYAGVLSVAEAYEEARWDRIEPLATSAGFAPAVVPATYHEALAWAQQIGRTL